MRYILFLFLLLLFPSFTYADDFHEGGDSFVNDFRDALGYGYRTLPLQGKCPMCVEFNLEDVKGSSVEYILNNVGLFDITSRDPKFGLIRNPQRYTSLDLPPFANASFIYWYLNEADHSVQIEKIKVFLSRYDSSLGDLRNVLFVNGHFEEIPTRVLFDIYPRAGIVKEYEGLGIVGQGKGGSLILDSLFVKPSVYFSHWELSVSNKKGYIRVYVKNSSDYLERNITYSHQEYSSTRDFLPNETYVYEYEVDIEENSSVGFASIHNPNSRKECIGFGEHLESNFIGESAIVVGVRKEGEILYPYVSSRLKPWGEAFCINRLAHTVHSMVIRYAEEEEVKGVESTESIDIVSLPKTAKLSILLSTLPLLVVVSGVWYYLKRKI